MTRVGNANKLTVAAIVTETGRKNLFTAFVRAEVVKEYPLR